jgi:lysophospholipase L1-like esterase
VSRRPATLLPILVALAATAVIQAGCGSAAKSTKPAHVAGAAQPPAAATPAGPHKARGAATADIGDAPPPEQSPQTRPRLVAALGDSITEGAPFWSSNPAIRRRYADEINSQSQYEYWARRRLGPKVRFRNCGISGQETGQIAVRFDQCTRGADTLIVQGGINDIAHGKSPAEAAANLKAMVVKGKARGLRTAITEVLPWNNGHPSADNPIRSLNAMIHAIAREEKVPVIDWYRILLDPAHPGEMRPSLTVEGDHPTVLGYKLLGEAVELP